MSDEPMDPTKPSKPVKPVKAVPGPADLAELKATDALLDRLAAGGLSAADRLDPLVAAFAELRVSLDEPSDDAGLDVARLIEVLGDRPLYLVDSEEAGDGSLADTPINLGLPARETTRTIDVRDAVREADSAADSASGAHRPPTPPTPLRRPVLPPPAAQVAARLGDVTTAAFGATVRTINSLTAGSRASHGRLDDEDKPNWRRIAEQVALPAASVIAVLAIGSGVSAAVTGDPMAPVAGMSRVVQQLPGISGDAPTTEAVNESIVRAGKLAGQGKAEQAQAQSLINQADDNVDDLPKAARPSIQGKINEVKEQLKGNTNGNTPASPAPTQPASSPSLTPSEIASPPTTAPTSPPASASASATPSPSTAATTSAGATDPAP